MADFQLDHNLSHRLAPELRALGHGCVTARDLGLEGADDDLHLTTATDAGRILVTHNRRDFIALHRVWHRWSRRWGAGERHAGILVLLPQKPELSELAAAQALDAIASRTVLVNQLYEYTRPPQSQWRHEHGFTV